MSECGIYEKWLELTKLKTDAKEESGTEKKDDEITNLTDSSRQSYLKNTKTYFLMLLFCLKSSSIVIIIEFLVFYWKRLFHFTKNALRILIQHILFYVNACVKSVV